MSYNGWKNYETWAWALWSDNEEHSYNWVRQLATEAIEQAPDHENVPDVWTEDEAARFVLADRLKDEAEEGMPTDGISGTVWADLLTAAFQEIDWYEIAGNLIDEVKQEVTQ